MLSLPTSVFLTTENGQKLVLTLGNSYGQHGVLVKHWKLWETSKDDRLPPFDEYRVPRDELFESPHVILKNCKIMDYVENPYPCGGKQHTDFTLGQSQQIEYHDCLDNFYNTEAHRNARLAWLWSAFEITYVSEDLQFPYTKDSDKGMQIQRDLVQFYSKPMWYTWLYWRKHLLDFPGVAGELVFRRDYVEKEPESKIEESMWIYSGTTDWGPATATNGTYYRI